MPRVTTHTTFNRHWNEYCVKLFVDGKHLEQADYFTDDKQDADDTAKFMVREIESKQTRR